jgi:hypothetical protein
MSNKKQPKTEQAAKPKNTITVYQYPDEPTEAAVARTLSRPEIRAAATIQQWNQSNTLNALAIELKGQIAEVNKGDMKRAEAMLLSQANTLDELFNNLAKRAHSQSLLPQFETMLRLALKAQTQCRATLETLSNIKNPPIVYAKQANFASGHQQINNGVPTHTGETKNQPNELLTELPDETLDTGRTGAAIEVYKAVATVD